MMRKKLAIPVRNGNDPKDIPNTDELVTQVVPLLAMPTRLSSCRIFARW